MAQRSPEVDAYIKKSPDFAKPMLRKLRTLFHKACPKVEETLKWGVPHFEYKGTLAGMAAFRQHMRFGFWKGRLLCDPRGNGLAGMTMNGPKLTDASQLPPDAVLLDLIRQAMQLNESGIKPPRPKKKLAPRELVAPDYFLASLRKNKKALTTFEALSYSHRKEYIEWITQARQEQTRQRRITTAIEWLCEGKNRNWKYERR